MVWDSDGRCKIHVGGETTEVDNPVKAEIIKELARNAGIVKFDVVDANGSILTPADFPKVATELYIREINQAKA